MTSEYVTYKAPKTNNMSNIEKSLEVMKWVLDPDSRPYESNDSQRIIVRSAGVSNSTIAEEKPHQRLSVQQMLEIRDKVLGE